MRLSSSADITEKELSRDNRTRDSGYLSVKSVTGSMKNRGSATRKCIGTTIFGSRTRMTFFEVVEIDRRMTSCKDEEEIRTL